MVLGSSGKYFSPLSLWSLPGHGSDVDFTQWSMEAWPKIIQLSSLEPSFDINLSIIVVTLFLLSIGLWFNIEVFWWECVFDILYYPSETVNNLTSVISIYLLSSQRNSETTNHQFSWLSLNFQQCCFHCQSEDWWDRTKACMWRVVYGNRRHRLRTVNSAALWLWQQGHDLT